MRNLLLTAAVAAALCAQASEVTLNVLDAADFVGVWKEDAVKEDGSIGTFAHWENLESMTIGGYAFTFTMLEGGNSNCWYTAANESGYTLRVYRGNTMTITAPEGEVMGSMVWNCTQMTAIEADNMVSANTGTCTLTNSKTITWTAEEPVQSVTFTIPVKKEGGNANPQVRIHEFTVSTEVGQVAPGPQEENFKLASEVVSGNRYVIVTDGKIASPVPAGSSYGYLQIGACTVDGSYVTAASDLAFTFDQSGAEWTIRQPDGRYLYLAGTYNSPNVSDKVEDGGLWNVTIEDDGTAAIVNVAKEKTIVYSENYNNYACYADVTGSQLPSLYGYEANIVIETEGETAAEAMYFGLDGIRINGEPKAGIYVRVLGNKANTVIVK